jgi:hypothetical protein
MRWRNEAITFGLLGTGLALAALAFTMAVRRSRLAAPL